MSAVIVIADCCNKRFIGIVKERISIDKEMAFSDLESSIEKTFTQEFSQLNRNSRSIESDHIVEQRTF